MIRRQRGFTLIELLLVIAIMALVMAATSKMFIALLNEFKQQSKIAESNIEGIVGLELLRQDIERAGYGLPWEVPIIYNEAAVTTYNDCSGVGPCNAPRPIVTGNNTDFVDTTVTPNSQSDYLVIKAANVIRNAASQKWTYLVTGATKTWDTSMVPSENPSNTDYVIVLSPGATTSDQRTLLTDGGGNWYKQYSGVSSFWPSSGDPQPLFVYDIIDNTGLTGLRMPFNRADYYISTSASYAASMCAPNTGTLIKAMISHVNGAKTDILPLLDCVANMQVVFRLDTNGDGLIDTATDDISGLNALLTRQQVKEIRVYILAHEGQMDKNFTYQNSSPAPCTSATQIYVGDPSIGGGRCFNIGTNTNYRWKIYTITIQPKNMRP
jgi:prepilin-type N-terminal cleavage/methylation domain-containing protein